MRAGAGVGGSDRVTLIWGANAVKKQWLELTVLGTAETGLAEPDVSYYGSAIGETGNSTANSMVTAVDALRIMQNVTLTAPISSRFDLNRDGRVGAADRLVVLNNLSAVSPLILLDLSCAPPADLAERADPVASRAPALASLRGGSGGLHGRWVSAGTPVIVWTTDDPVWGVWEPLEEISEVPPAGAALEWVLPVDPEGPARFYRLEAAPLR